MNKRTVMAGVVAALALACSDETGDLAGSMMRDAGHYARNSGERSGYRWNTVQLVIAP